MGNATRALLLFDAESRIIGFRSTDSDLAAYTVGHSGGGKSSTTRAIRSPSFADFCGIDRSEARQWDAYLEDGVLCIDLKVPGRIVTRRVLSKRAERE